ncbi:MULTISPECIES: pseudouridine synthase [Clostridium]|uniref:pseudouridine synthase n=1 Tax=Clostridium TaxID=1485 RepID=UPI00069EFC41|nr:MULTISPECIES: pseudouridine synthase [Clostridium]KOF57945.1 pseudouridine synthase [Clostridium sp. DMHC 10]MCD2345916.1 rRNA pseudouridine synthase [Clostridium guangxiense]
MEERLQKYMASCGVASRRKCEKLIEEGRVSVNGVTITELGFKINTDSDKVFLDGKPIKIEEKKIYIALNKPKGYITASSDNRGRKTVIDIFDFKERLFPVGRLDYETSGLLIITNDGEIFNKIMHPKQNINKTYIALVSGIPDETEISTLKKGVDIGGYITAPSEASIVKVEGKNSILKIVIHEGKKRQVRRMCRAIHHHVIELKRVSIGSITLGDLEVGQWRYLSKDEVNYLMNI